MRDSRDFGISIILRTALLMDINSNDRQIRQILKGQSFFIPRFQRAYSWENEQIDEFWEDAVEDNTGDYFIGPMVVYPHGQDFGVVDGQQRLTTVTILLCVIRDAAAAAGLDNLAAGTHVFIEHTDENNKDRFVLETETSHPFLGAQILARKKVQLKAQTGAEERSLMRAHGQLTEEIDSVVRGALENKSLSQKRRLERLERDLRRIRDQILDLSLILVEVGTEDDAKTIFVTLNARGLDLTTADLIKTHVLDKLPSSSARNDHPKIRWDALMGRLDGATGSLGMDEFLLASWQSRQEYVGKNSLYKKVRRAVKGKKAKSGLRVDEYLDQLEIDVEAYIHALSPDSRRWTTQERAVRQSLEFFRDQRIRQPAPLLLALLRARSQEKLSLKNLKSALRAIEHYHFSHTVVASKSSSGGWSARYSSLARAVLGASNQNEASQVLGDIKLKLRTAMPSLMEFEEGFGALWFTDDETSQRSQVRYALRKLWEHQAPAGTALDMSSMTVEHLCPQSTSEADDAAEVGHVGNLLLIDESLNNKLADKAFAQKKKALQASNAYVPPEIQKASAWGHAEIKTRTATLATLGHEKVWTI